MHWWQWDLYRLRRIIHYPLPGCKISWFLNEKVCLIGYLNCLVQLLGVGCTFQSNGNILKISEQCVYSAFIFCLIVCILTYNCKSSTPDECEVWYLWIPMWVNDFSKSVSQGTVGDVDCFCPPMLTHSVAVPKGSSFFQSSRNFYLNSCNSLYKF